MKIDEISNLYRRYGPLVERRCRRILGSAADAGDASQETFIRAFERLETFRGEGERLAWLYRISTHVCLNLLRSRRRRGDEWLAEAQDALGPGHVTPSDATEARQQLSRLLEATEDELTRGLLVLVHLDGLSQGEAARILGVSRATANARLGRLREQAQAIAGEGP